MILKRDSHGRHVCGYESNLLRSCGSLSRTEALVLLGELPFGGGEACSPKQKGEKSDGVGHWLIFSS